MFKKVPEIFKVKTTGQSMSKGRSLEISQSMSQGISQPISPQAISQAKQPTLKGSISFGNESSDLTFDLEQKTLSTLLKESLTENGINILDFSGVKRLQSALNSLGYGPIKIGENFSTKENITEIDKILKECGLIDASALRNNKLSHSQLALIKYQLNQGNLKVTAKPDFQSITLMAFQLSENQNRANYINRTNEEPGSLNKELKITKLNSIPKEEFNKPAPKLIKVKTNHISSFDASSSNSKVFAKKLWKILQVQDSISSDSSEKILEHLTQAVKTPGKLKEISHSYSDLKGTTLGRGRLVNSGSIINDLKQVKAPGKLVSQVERLFNSSS